jgi:Tfp pilus assembly protein FimV
VRVVLHVVIAAVVAGAACRGDDAKVEQLEQQVDDLTRQLATLRKELETRKARAANAPVEAPWISPDCRAYLITVSAYVECDKIPQASRDAAAQGAAALTTSWSRTPSQDQMDAASEQCRATAAALRDGARTIGCPMIPVERAP